MEPSYTKFVDSLSARYPTLTALASFLMHRSPNSVCASTIQCINLLKDGAVEQITNITLDKLLLHVKYHANKFQEGSGLLILLEDPRPVDVEELGAALDINPLFFGGHIATSYEDVEKKPLPPVMTMFPSQAAAQEFIHIHCQKVVDLGEESLFHDVPYKLVVPGNVPRLVRRMQTLSGRQLGLVRTCTSVLLKRLSEERWVCLMLLDSTTRDITVDKTKHTNLRFDGLRFPQVPRRIHTEDFQEIPSYSSFCRGKSNLGQMPASLLDHLAEAFRTPPPGLEVSSPNILSLAYYPLRIALAEWMLYSFLMSGYVKYYEYTFETVHQRVHSAENQDFKDLHRWRRRGNQSLHKLRLLEGFVQQWREHGAASAETDRLLQDIQHVAGQIEKHSHSLETMGPIITSMIQLQDSRRSIEEAVNVRQLTYIVLVFVPLSYAASIFSMADDYAPGKEKFWIYFATAVPLTLLILAASRLPMQHRVPRSSFHVYWNLGLGQRTRRQPPV